MAVMIFVVDAMGLRAWALRSYSTLPVSMLSTMAAGDVMLGGLRRQNRRGRKHLSGSSPSGRRTRDGRGRATVMVVVVAERHSRQHAPDDREHHHEQKERQKPPPSYT